MARESVGVLQDLAGLRLRQRSLVADLRRLLNMSVLLMGMFGRSLAL